MRRLCASIAFVFVVGACGGDDAGDPTTTTEATGTTTTVVSTTVDDPSTTVDDPTTTVTTASPATTDPPGDDDLPGEVIELFPYDGASLAVVGVERDDTLAVHSGPGTDFDVAHELSPLDTDVIATGHNRQVDDAIWAEVDKDGHRGWADAASLLHLGTTDDITEQLADPSGELPTGETMDDVANAVAELRASTEPPSRIAIIEHPEVGELGSITVDVIGMGDDALGGERLMILAEPVPGAETFVVQTVQRLALCSRGVTDDALCV